MKRDFDIIKHILTAVEELPNGTGPTRLSINGIDENVIQYHLELLFECNYITGQQLNSGYILPRRLTMEGHDFLSASMNDTVWNITKSFLKEKGVNATIDIFKDLLISFTTKLLKLD